MSRKQLRIELKHIQEAMDKRPQKEISTERLADWATMLLLNDGRIRNLGER